MKRYGPGAHLPPLEFVSLLATNASTEEGIAVRQMCLAFLFVLLVVWTATAQSIRLKIGPPNPNIVEYFGSHLAEAGDINGDGVGDLIVGDEFYSDISASNRGCARILSGRTGQSLQFFVGAAADDQLGTTVAVLGDVNGDGSIEYVVGAPRFDGPAGIDSGRIYVRSVNSLFSYTIDGPNASARLGTALAVVGDQNGDGINDFAIGAPQAQGVGSNAGRVEVRSGLDGSAIFSAVGASGQRLGAAIIGADVDGDGLTDVVACATHASAQGAQTGRIIAFAHGTGQFLGQMDGFAAGDQFGRVLGAIHDIDGDGKQEIVAGCPRSDFAATDSGSVFIVSPLTSTLHATLRGVVANEIFGIAIATGDISGDGTIEIMIGASGASGPDGLAQGRVVIVDGHGNVLSEITGDHSGDEFGSACAFLERGIGGPELAVGAWRDDAVQSPNSDKGSVTIFEFEAPGLPVVVRAPGVERLAHADATTISDIDGDLRADIVLVESNTSTFNGVLGGVSRIAAYSGATGTKIWSIGGNLGSTVARISVVGDQSGDGVEDLVATDVTGALKFISGADGLTFATVPNSSVVGAPGADVATLDDLDGDGIAEVAISTVVGAFAPTGGRVDILHGGDFVPLLTIGDPDPDFGIEILDISDRDSDGHRDLVVRRLSTPPGGPATMEYRIFSSVTGATLASFSVPYAAAFQDLEPEFVALGDIDGDGEEDFACPSGNLVRIISGATLLPIFASVESGTVTSCGDVNGDGRADYTTIEPAINTSEESILSLRSGLDRSLIAQTVIARRPSALHPAVRSGTGDIDGDGFDDAICVAKSGPATNDLYPSTEVYSLVGAARFAHRVENPHDLAASWVPVGSMGPAIGQVRITGGPGFGIGVIAASSRRERALVAGEVTLLPLDPTATILSFFGFDAAGVADFAVDLRQPALANSTIFVQAFAIDGNSASGFTSSNGLDLRFID